MSICLPPDPNPARLDYTLPANSCDSHLHIFAELSQFPHLNTRLFVPPIATFEMYKSLQSRMGLSRAVVVHSAIYGTDLSCTIDALKKGAGSWRGIALVEPDITDEQLFTLDAIGFTGIRINFPDWGGNSELASKLANKIKQFGWHLQLLITLDQLHDNWRQLTDLGIPIVIDHMGYTKSAVALKHSGLKIFLDMLKDGYFWTKISGFDRVGTKEQQYNDVKPLVEKIISANPNHVVWGSDWPHVRRNPVPNDGAMLNKALSLIPDKKMQKLLLVENPANLYRFT